MEVMALAAHTTNDARIWHSRYSYLGYKNMKRLMKEDMGKGLLVTAYKLDDEKQRVFEPCINGKQPCQPFKLLPGTPSSRWERRCTHRRVWTYGSIIGWGCEVLRVIHR
jgi:hypothetical protein